MGIISDLPGNMAKVLNFGSLNFDYVYSVERFVRSGETISSTAMETFCGGKGLNQSIALARAGASIYHAGAVGENGDALINVLVKNKVDTSFIRTVEGPSGHAIIQRDSNGQNCIVLFGGSNRKITDEHVESAVSYFSEGDYLVLQNEINNIPSILLRAKEKGMRIVLNPSPLDDAILSLPLELVDIFMLNEVEAEILCGASSPSVMMENLKKKFPNAAVVLTLGKMGVLYQAPHMQSYISHGIYHVPVVDTTAAGDTFTGFFISCMSRGDTVEYALDIASKASSLAVSRKGAEPSIPTMDDVLASELMPEEPSVNR